MFYSTDSLVDIVHCQIHLMYLALRNKNGTLACMSREKPSLGRNIAHCHPFTMEGRPTLWPCSVTPKYLPFSSLTVLAKDNMPSPESLPSPTHNWESLCEMQPSMMLSNYQGVAFTPLQWFIRSTCTQTPQFLLWQDSGLLLTGYLLLQGQGLCDFCVSTTWFQSAVEWDWTVFADILQFSNR